MYTSPEKHIHHKLMKETRKRENLEGRSEMWWGRKDRVNVSRYEPSWHRASFCSFSPESAECPFSFFFLSLLSIYTHIQTPYQLEFGGHTRSNFTALGPNHLSTCNFITVREYWAAAHTQTRNSARRATARIVALNVPLPDNGGTHAVPKSYFPWSGTQRIILLNSPNHKIMWVATV